MDAAVVSDDSQVGNAWLIFQWNISFSSLSQVSHRPWPAQLRVSSKFDLQRSFIYLAV